MTCKDCKRYDDCVGAKTNPIEDEDDGWAEMCSRYESIHPDKEVEEDGMVIVQTGYNWHVHVIDKATGKMVMHVSATKEMTEDDLRSFAKLHRMLLEEH